MSTLDAVRDFLALEARLLDSGRYRAWADLYTEDCLYWVPIDPAQTDPYAAPSHVLDDKQLILARAERLEVPRHLSPEPAARTIHAVSNVVFEDLGDLAADYRVGSTLVCVEYRRRDYGEADQRTFAAQVSHGLRLEGASFRIAFKRVDLVNADAPFNAIAAPF